jgi:hypothetical protein
VRPQALSSASRRTIPARPAAVREIVGRRIPRF